MGLVLAMVLGTMAAMAMARFQFFGKSAVSFILVLPIALPGIVTGIALQNTFARTINLGLFSFRGLSVREYPAIDEPQVSVQTNYSGASAGIIESQVTQVLEGSLAGIEGIDTIESTSRAESSRITVRFRSTVNIDAATSDVRDRVSRVRRQLPDEITEPVISKVEADAQPIAFGAA